MNKLEVILIRHGETDYNSDGRFGGLTDISINSNGEKQAKSLRRKLKKEHFDMIYSSNLTRCRETVELLKFKVGITYSKNLQEMNFGRWEGLTYEEVERNYSLQVKEWKQDWINYGIPKGESFSKMAERVIDEFERIKKNPISKVALITHGGCIRTILGHYLMDSIEQCWKFYIDNGSISRLIFDDNYVYLKTLNEK